LDHGLRGFHGLEAGSGQSNYGRPNIVLKLRALPSETNMRSRKSLIFNPPFMQVVDFHDFCRSFRCFLEKRRGETLPRRNSISWDCIKDRQRLARHGQSRVQFRAGWVRKIAPYGAISVFIAPYRTLSQFIFFPRESPKDDGGSQKITN
jgi:hypothetical protein